MRRGYRLAWCVVAIVSCVLVSGSFVRAGDKITFPATKEEILKELFDKPLGTSVDVDLIRKNEGKRGLGGVVDDKKLPSVAASIQFDTNSAIIKPESLSLLCLYGEALQERRNTVLIVEGHTDSTGSEGYNLRLSQRRAESVKKFLLEQYGVGANRLIVSAYGEDKPIASNDTDAGRAKNRRVQFTRVQ